jgi:hypothetical protein
LPQNFLTFPNLILILNFLLGRDIAMGGTRPLTVKGIEKEAEVNFCSQENTLVDENFKAEFVYFTDLIYLNLSDKIFIFIF